MARSRKHKADGLFYVTQQMLFGNSACYAARVSVARWQAALFNPKLTRSELFMVEVDNFDDTHIPVTIGLVRYIQDQAVGGVHFWLLKRVERYSDEALNWQTDAIKRPDFNYIPRDEQVMDTLYLLAKRRGLIE